MNYYIVSLRNIGKKKLGLFCTCLIYVGSGIRIRDDKKRPDPGSGINIPDPQH
jgi:hypothetical protein